MVNKYTADRFVSDTHKECSLCGVIKTHVLFHKDKNNKRGRGLAYYCKECANKKGRLWHEENKNKPIVIASRRNRYLKFTYGITAEDYAVLTATQENKCAICGVEFHDKPKSFIHTDHCHDSGKIRGILCTNCNRGIGHFQESKQFLTKAIEYLNEHK